MLRTLTGTLLALALTPWPAPPPPAPIRPVVDHYPGGVTTTDPYRWMEHPAAPEVRRYFKQQSDYTNAVLGRLGPAREKLRADIGRLIDAGSSVSSIEVVDDQLFYLERPPGANDAKLMVRAGSAAPRLLADPDLIGKQLGIAGHVIIEQYVPSFDGAHVAIALVAGGAERNATVRVVTTATGALLADSIPRAFPDTWSPDGTRLIYMQYNAVVPGHEIEAELNERLYVHALGATGSDPVVFGAGHDPNVPFVPTDEPGIAISPASTWAIGQINHGVRNELTLYVAPVGAVLAGGTIPWRKIADVDDDVTSYDIRGDRMFVLDHKGASNYQVSQLDLSQPAATAATAPTIVPAGAGVIQQVAVAKDGLYVRGIEAGPAELRKMPFASDGSLGAIVPVTLPFAGTIDEFATDPRVDGATLALSSWTHPALVYALSPSGTLTDTGVRKRPNIDTSNYVAQEVLVPSTGGVMVPVSIVMNRNVKRDGSNPTYLEAYGAYGLNIDPYFLGDRFAWLDAGGIWVVAHVRGGGEYGEDWHLGGKGATKQHTIDDAIAAARWLIAQKYTSPAHLAIEGTSAGGIMVGGAITQHPELFAAALDVVGLTDAIRMAQDANGAVNFPEFGDPSKPDEARNLYAMDAYLHVVDGRRYPAVMGITGINDPRVPPWMVAKFVARVAHATSSGRPVLLRVDYDAGHGFLAASRAQAVSLLTDELSFLMWQCGSPAYAAIPMRRPR
jgi:prolyl oligopeptidase